MSTFQYPTQHTQHSASPAHFYWVWACHGRFYSQLIPGWKKILEIQAQDDEKLLNQGTNKLGRSYTHQKGAEMPLRPSTESMFPAQESADWRSVGGGPAAGT